MNRPSVELKFTVREVGKRDTISSKRNFVKIYPSLDRIKVYLIFSNLRPTEIYGVIFFLLREQRERQGIRRSNPGRRTFPYRPED